MDHAAAEHFHPALLTADNAAALLHRPADVDLGRRLGEGKVAGAHPDGDVIALEKGPEERLQRPFQMPHVYGAVDDQSLDLVEHRRVRGVAVAAIDTSRRDDP